MREYPISNNRDLGYGFTFFPQSYTDREDGKTYRWETFVPTVGYCPGCNVTHRSGCFMIPRTSKKAKHSHSNAYASKFSKHQQQNQTDTMMTDFNSSPPSPNTTHQQTISPYFPPTPFNHHVPSSTLEVQPNDAFFNTTSSTPTTLENHEHSPGLAPTFPQNSPLVYAETEYSGPHNSCPDFEEDQEWLEWEFRRIARVRRILDRWVDRVTSDRGG